MLKVLIVDDEFLVRVGLESTIPWESYGFKVVGSARNGKEAIPLFQKHDPDVLLTDIRMPLMGGLELIETLKKMKPSLVAVIITHYDDFNYAQEALKLGANDYVLKTELSPENLVKTIRKHIDNDSINSHTASSHPADPLLYDLNSHDDLMQIQKYTEAFLSDRPFAALIIKLYYRLQNEDKRGNFDLIRAFDNISSNVPFTGFNMKTFSCADREVLYVFDFEHPFSPENPDDPLLDYIKLLRENIDLYLDIDTLVGLSSVHTSAHKLQKAINEARLSLKMSFFRSSGVVQYTSDMARVNTPSPQFDAAFLRQSIIAGDYNINNYIQNILAQLKSAQNMDSAKIMYTELLDLANELSEQQNNNLRFGFDFEDFPGFESLKEYITSMFNQLVQSKSMPYSFIISRCIKYIEDNYMNNISLSDLADYTHKSKSYLSTLFKMETNVNFSTFLINYRIEKAKLLLKESDSKIYEIAEQVGFNNPYYFSKVFKDITGLSCKTYRDKHYRGRSK